MAAALPVSLALKMTMLAVISMPEPAENLPIPANHYSSRDADIRADLGRRNGPADSRSGDFHRSAGIFAVKQLLAQHVLLGRRTEHA